MNPLQIPAGNRGFTLAETMIVVALIALMTGFGYSGFSSWIAKERVRAVANLFAGHLKEARIRSIEKHTPHTVVYDYTSNQYDAFMDSDLDLTRDVDKGEIEVAKVDVAKEYSTVTGKNPGIHSGSTVKFQFDVRGFPNQSDSILFFNANADPTGVVCLNNDCCRMESAANGPNCESGLCCATCVSYGDIKVVCNDAY